MLAGIESQVALCLSDPDVNNYHLSGHKSYNVAIKRFFGICSVVAIPAERVLLELLKDDRLLRRAEEMKGIVNDAMSSIIDMPSIIWSRLASIVGGELTAHDSRSSTIPRDGGGGDDDAGIASRRAAVVVVGLVLGARSGFGVARSDLVLRNETARGGGGGGKDDFPATSGGTSSSSSSSSSPSSSSSASSSSP